MVIFSLVTLVVTALPLLIIPPTLLVAATRAAIHGHCCQVWRCSPHFKDFKEHQSCFNISYQIMTTQADQFKTTPYTSLNIKGSHLIRWSSSNPPGSCFLSSWSPWFTWAPSLAAFYQGNTVLKMFLIKRHVFFPLCSIKDIQARPEDGGVWDWIARCSCASAGFQRNQLNVKMISNTYT